MYQRYFLDIAYNGTRYHGWQVQANAPTVQAALDRALATLLRRPTDTLGSGRTDTGVHAARQIVHFDGPCGLEAKAFLHSLNALLPPDIAANGLYPVAAAAHARFDATWRRYEYRICPGKNPFLPKMCYRYNVRPAVEAMNDAAAVLLQHTDFECFSKVKTDVNHFHCTVTHAHWQCEDARLVFHIRANRFLRGMVRAVVGTLLEVGEGRLDAAGFSNIIRQKDRRKAGRAVPPEGLFLTDVEYPPSVVVLQNVCAPWR